VRGLARAHGRSPERFSAVFRASRPRLRLSFGCVHFEIAHEFDIPLDAVELAVLSPSLVEKLAPRLSNIEHVSQKQFDLKDGVLARTWHYQANVKVPDFAQKYVTRDMCAWDETSVYDLKKHASTWAIVPSVKPEWQKYFSASGTYELTKLEDGRTRRVVRGELALNVKYVRQVAERMIVNEVKKTFEAEAATLRDLATLV
jgi:hypothetical protein